VTTTDYRFLPPEFQSSHGKILQDSAKTDITLADVTIDPSLLVKALGSGVNAFAAVYEVGHWAESVGDDEWWDGPVEGLAILTSPVWVPITAIVGQASAGMASFNFKAQGSWLKMNSLLVTAQWPNPAAPSNPITKKLTRQDNEQTIMHRRMFTGRAKGAHLALNRQRITDLAASYPKLPDGRDLELQTMHSTVRGIGDLVKQILSENIAGICDQNNDLRNLSCYGFARSFEKGWIADLLIDDINVKLPWLAFLDTWQSGFLARTDFAVDDQSQQAVRADNIWEPERHPGKFQNPRGYELRRYFTYGRFPDSLAPHGEMGVSFDEEFLGRRFRGNAPVIGAPQLGHDIYCAIAPECRDLMGIGGGSVVRLPERTGGRFGGSVILPGGAGLLPMPASADSITLSGDFQFGVLPDDADAIAYRLSTPSGTGIVTIRFGSGEGVVLIRADGSSKVIVPQGYLTRPQLQRRGDSLFVKAITWRGQEVRDSFLLPPQTPDLTLGVVRPFLSNSRPLLVGRMNVDSALRDPRSGTEVKVWFREARGSQTKYSMPRIAVQNTGTDTIRGLKLRYLFRADPDHPPVLENPNNAPWGVVRKEGDLWALIYEDETTVIAPGQVGPSPEQAKIRLRMDNNAQWDVWKDPSNDRNLGVFLENQNIQAWDGSGKHLWGRDVARGDDYRPDFQKVTVWTREAAIGESNVSKPQIEVRNDGTVPLRKLTATWFVAMPAGQTPVVDSWYVPESQISTHSLGNDYWAVDVRLGRWIQPGEKIAGGEFGIHLTNWPNWNRAKSPSAMVGKDGIWVENPWVVVTDSSGKVLWGNVPDLVGDVDTSAGPDTGGVTDTVQVPVDTILPGVGIEIRNESPTDTFTIKPRVRLTNNGSLDVNAFSLVFPVRPGPGQVVVGDLWYPQPNPQGCNLSQRAGLSGLLDVVLTCRNQLIRPGAVWPDQSGAVFGVHDQNWHGWDTSDDPAFSSMTGSWAPASGVRILKVSNP
jgi:hypothetical protein